MSPRRATNDRPKRPRGACPICFTQHALRGDGTVHGHRRAPVEPRPVRDWEMCPGSGQQPRAAS